MRQSLEAKLQLIKKNDLTYLFIKKIKWSKLKLISDFAVNESSYRLNHVRKFFIFSVRLFFFTKNVPSKCKKNKIIGDKPKSYQRTFE